MNPTAESIYCTEAAAQLPIIGNQRYTVCCVGVKLLFFEAIIQNLVPGGIHSIMS